MNNNLPSQSGLFNPRIFVAFTLCFLGTLLAVLSFAANPPGGMTGALGSSARDSVFVDKYAGPLSSNAAAATASMPLAPTGPGWSIVTSPNASPSQPLQAVTCVSASDCWAVGNYFDGTTSRALTEHWNGTSWSIVSSPGTDVLSSVKCVSGSDCWAVGGNGLIEHWNGSAWSIVPSPSSGILNGVTCMSSLDCWAVGGNGLIEHWNGSAWSIVASPSSGTLNGVTCASSNDCWTVGYYNDGFGDNLTLTEHWNGTSWAIVSSPNFFSNTQNFLNGVTCVSSNDCWAVGSSIDSMGGYQTLIEQWNGTSWSLASSADNSLVDGLGSVTCASASQCWAVGSSVVNGVVQTLIEKLNGSSWAIITSPNTSATQSNQLIGVTCASGAECWAVGSVSSYINGSAPQTLIEQWNGTSWAIVSSPQIGTQANVLNSVTCVSASDCWAVGYYSIGSFLHQTLIEHWNGTSWLIYTSPNSSSTQFNELNGVTCTSASDCWAVGQYINPSIGTSGLNQTLIEHWNGTAWAIVISPNKLSSGGASQGNLLAGVTCVSASDCWAVGYYVNDRSAVQTLIVQWDGSSWSLGASPNSSITEDNYLNGVTCASASDCWAVGYYHNNNTLIERWNGSSWFIFPSSNNSMQYNQLQGVTCTATNRCWAVGSYYNPGIGTFQTLIEGWDGSSWTIVTSRNTSETQSNQLYGVTCASASECWAVGIGGGQTLIEHLIAGSNSWAIVTSPNTSATQGNQLYGVTCASSSECWAVGYYNGSSAAQTLIELYTLTIPPLSSVVSRMTHGSAGMFDINLPLTGTRGVECRSSSSLGAGKYAVVFTFLNNVTSCGTAGTAGGSVSSGPNLNQCTENLTGVIPPNAPGGEYLTVTLNNVVDTAGNNGNVSATMGVLVGDVNASGVVTSGDTNLCKGQALQPLTNANFRNDINASGAITTGDANIIKQNALHQLPSPP